MNTYGCFYEDKQIEVYAETSYAAQKEAREHFQKIYPRRKVKGYNVLVVLEKTNGKTVVHKPSF